jgi:hypothetical protein
MLLRLLKTLFFRSPPETDLDQHRARLQRVRAELKIVLAGLQSGDIALEDLGE